jgi:uncharacterized protein Usg
MNIAANIMIQMSNIENFCKSLTLVLSGLQHPEQTLSTADADFVRMLAGYSLTTAEIIYRLPDHPALMQSYIWQDYDLHPRFPKLKAFLDFWSSNLEGRLHQVLVAHAGLIKPRELRLVGAELRLQ